MPCTTLLVGKNASYDGSTIIGRNDDSPSGVFTEKKLVAFKKENLKDTYTSVISHVKVSLPKEGLDFTMMPNVDKKEGIWAACGVNEKNVGMTATETITSNARVLGADPLVNYVPKKKLPIEDFLRPQRRFKHLFKPGKEELIARIQAEVDRKWEELLAKAK